MVEHDTRPQVQGFVDHLKQGGVSASQREGIGAQRVVGDRDVCDFDGAAGAGVLRQTGDHVVERDGRGGFVHIGHADDEVLGAGVACGIGGVDADHIAAEGFKIWRIIELQHTIEQIKSRTVGAPQSVAQSGVVAGSGGVDRGRRVDVLLHDDMVGTGEHRLAVVDRKVVHAGRGHCAQALIGQVARDGGPAKTQAFDGHLCVGARNGRGDKGQHGGGSFGARTKYGTVLGQHVFAVHIEHQHGLAVGGVDGDWLAECDGECE